MTRSARTELALDVVEDALREWLPRVGILTSTLELEQRLDDAGRKAAESAREVAEAGGSMSDVWLATAGELGAAIVFEMALDIQDERPVLRPVE